MFEKRRAHAGQRRRGDCETRAADSVRPARLQQRRGILGRVPLRELVADGRDDEHAVVERVLDRVTLDRRRSGSAEADVDDPRAVVDGVDDPGGLVDVGERPVRGAGLDDEELRVAARARDSVAVRHGTGRDRCDERPVAVVVADVAGAGARVVGGGGLRREIGRRQVGAGVDDGDLDRGGCAQHRVGDAVLVRTAVLPLPAGGGARECERHRRLGRCAACGRAGDKADALGTTERLPRDARPHLNRMQCREQPHERGAAESSRKPRRRRVADDEHAARSGCVRAHRTDAIRCRRSAADDYQGRYRRCDSHTRPLHHIPRS